MSSKLAILILGLLAILLFISSEVAASDSKEVTNGVDDAKYPGGGGYPGNGGGYGGYPGRGGGYPGRGGGYPGRGGGYPGRGGGYPGGRGGGYPGRGGGRGGGGGGYCQYGCCSGAYLGGCGRCCYYAGEAVDSQTKDNTHN